MKPRRIHASPLYGVGLEPDIGTQLDCPMHHAGGLYRNICVPASQTFTAADTCICATSTGLRFRDTIVIFQITWLNIHCPDGGHQLSSMNMVVMVSAVALRDKLGPKLVAKAVLLFLASSVRG